MFGDLYFEIQGDAITLCCMHADHGRTIKAIAYYGEAGYLGDHLPLFQELDGLVTFMREHVLSHFTAQS